jgi:hypothetical protein
MLIVNGILSVGFVYGRVRTDFAADSAVFAGFGINNRPLVSPASGSIIDRGPSLNYGTQSDFHNASSNSAAVVASCAIT